jgi:hypothetical protein
MKYIITILVIVFNFISYSQCTSCEHCIIINEFVVDPKDGENGNSSSTGEFIELYNKCNEDVNISCFVLCVSDDTNVVRGDCITIPSGTVLASGDVYLLGGYGTNCTGGETDCDWDGITLDYNWHSNASEIWDIRNNQFFTSNSGSYIGVLLDGGEEISLHSCTGNFLEGFKYSNGSGTYNTTETIQSVNGCSAKSITIDSDQIINIGSSPGSSGTDEGWIRECDNTWSFNPLNTQNPGISNLCLTENCITSMSWEISQKKDGTLYNAQIRIKQKIYYNLLGQKISDSINASFMFIEEMNGKSYIQKIYK